MLDATAQQKFSCPSCEGAARRIWQGNDWQENGEAEQRIVFIPLPDIPLPILRFS
jgi:hypothetical protein